MPVRGLPGPELVFETRRDRVTGYRLCNGGQIGAIVVFGYDTVTADLDFLGPRCQIDLDSDCARSEVS